MSGSKFARYTPLEAVASASNMAVMLADQLGYAAATEGTEEGAAEAAETLCRAARGIADLLEAARGWDR